MLMLLRLVLFANCARTNRSTWQNGSLERMLILHSTQHDTQHSIQEMHRWEKPVAETIREVVQYPDQANPSPKTLTTILYKDGIPISWGWTAKKQMMALSSRDLDINNYVYLQHFKLAMNHRSRRSLPSGFDSVRVAADYLRFLSEHAVQTMRSGYGPMFHADLIQWCITVPANWDELTKNQVRQAAYLAGMIKHPNSDALLIVYEPEGAALSVARSGDANSSIQAGDHFMIVDAGGGTVDVTSHTAVERNGVIVLSETAYCRGGFAGSSYVDGAWREYYRHQVGARAFDAWAQQHPGEFLQLEGEWERLKQAFGPHSSDTRYVPVPESLLDLMTPDERRQLEERQDGYDDRVYLTTQFMQGFFDPVVAEVIDLVQQQLQAARQLPPNKLMLVGGFSESPYLVHRIREAVQGQVPHMLVPPHPQKAVMQGAVLYGSKPELIHARRSRLTYGVPHCALHFPGAPDQLWDEEGQCYYTSRAFTPFVRRGDEVQVNAEVQHTFFPMFNGQRVVEVPLYATESTTATCVPYEEQEVGAGAAAMQHMATLEVHLPPTPDTKSHIIRVTLQFGRTEITATARDESTGDECNTKVVFAPARQHRAA